VLPTVSQQRSPADRRRIGGLRGELDWIVMKALEKDRARRYESASAFAADVQRYLDDQSVQAWPPSAGYRFRKFARPREAALATASVAGLAVLMALATLTVSAFLIARAEKRALERERREAYFQRITLAHHDLSAENLAAALRRLRDCPKDLRDWEWHYLMR